MCVGCLQVQRVLKFTSITAILGVLLCVAEMIRIISPYGLIITSSRPGIWPWFVLQTISRSIEFAMGATIANITKQPVNRPHHYAYSMRHKAHRESLYLWSTSHNNKSVFISSARVCTKLPPYHNSSHYKRPCCLKSFGNDDDSSSEKEIIYI